MQPAPKLAAVKGGLHQCPDLSADSRIRHRETAPTDARPCPIGSCLYGPRAWSCAYRKARLNEKMGVSRARPLRMCHIDTSRFASDPVNDPLSREPLRARCPVRLPLGPEVTGHACDTPGCANRYAGSDILGRASRGALCRRRPQLWPVSSENAGRGRCVRYVIGGRLQ